MGGALLGGLIQAGWAPSSDLAVVEVDRAAAAALEAEHRGLTVTDRPLPGVDAVVAVKPPLVVAVCRQLAQPPAPARVLSVAAGIPAATVEAQLGAPTRVLRAMPNTPALVGAGASALSPGAAATPDDVEWASSILAAVGIVVVVPEALLDAVTGLSGSGPAYVFLVLEALVDAGVNAGLPRATAEALAGQTLLGSARLALESRQSPADLRAGVTTPAGTTAAGLRVLEQRAVRAALIDAVAAATERSRELGRSG